jgi:hypothetical protein
MDRVRTSIVWVSALAMGCLCLSAAAPASSRQRGAARPDAAKPNPPRPVLRAEATPARMREIKTKYYRIHTDLEPKLADELARRMDEMYDLYSRRLSGFQPADKQKAIPRFEVYLYRRQQDYLKLTGERLKNTGGVFMSGRNLLASFLGDLGRDSLRRTLQHEAFHQFAHAVISPDLPVWLNEGLAQVFEEGIWTGSQFDLEQVPPRRLRQLRDDMDNKRLIKFETLMTLTPEQWAKRLEDDHGSGATHYNQSWAMVYFLVNAPGPDDKPLYRARLLQMLKLLNEGKGGEQAFRDTFGNNLEGFQKRFVDYARQLEASDEATLIENQEVLADLLVELRGRGTTFASVSELKQAAVKEGYRMHYTRGSLSWQTESNISVYFADADRKPLRDDQLFFQIRADAPLPDLICRYRHDAQLRTRFYFQDGEIKHEVLVEPLVNAAPIVGAGRD